MFGKLEVLGIGKIRREFPWLLLDSCEDLFCFEKNQAVNPVVEVHVFADFPFFDTSY